MGILAWNAEGEVCPFEGQHIFFRFPLSTPLPLDTASNYPRKEILKLSTWAAFFLPEVNYQHENEQEVMNEDM